MKGKPVRVKKNFRILNKIIKDIIREAPKNAAHVGVLKPEAAFVYESGLTMYQVAYDNEYGVPERSGKFIPPRPFIRPAYRDNNLKHVKVGMKSWKIKVNSTLAGILDDYGQSLAIKISQNIIDKETPQNAPYTIEKKGFDDPLVETGKLHSSIRSRIRKSSGSSGSSK